MELAGYGDVDDSELQFEGQIGCLGCLRLDQGEVGVFWRVLKGFGKEAMEFDANQHY